MEEGKATGGDSPLLGVRVSAHTPGPFAVGQLYNGTIRIDESERCAGMVFVEPAALGRPDGLARAESTARLWAASSNLLAAAKDAQSWLEALRDPASDPGMVARGELTVWAALRDAVAKAEGR